MDLEIYYHAPVGFNLLFEDQIISIEKDSVYQKIIYCPEFKEYKLRVQCNNIDVTSSPIEIKRLVFDNFWELSGEKIARGHNIYDDSYKKYAKNHGIEIVEPVIDNHWLFFTGELVFTFFHPIHEYIHKTLY